jgi:sialate O-acetylesterase
LEDAVYWVAFRDMQRTLTAIPHTAMVVSIDSGEENDLHPTGKMPIGQRLAYAAFQEVYGENGDWLSPLISGVESESGSGTLILQFANAADGLETRDGKAPAGLEIEWRKELTGQVIVTPVTGTITENRVILPLAGLGTNVARTIIAVRYAYSNTPKEANLCNKKGLPASPFSIKL